MLKWILLTIFSLSHSVLGAESEIATVTGNPAHVSKQGHPIKVISVAAGKSETAPKRLLVQGGMHGNETLTVEFVSWLASRMQKKQSLLNRLPTSVIVDFIPNLNPDAYGKSRYNASGVNLNRNFSKYWGNTWEPQGPYPFSEPETRALKALMQNRDYIAAIDVHGYVNWVVLPSTPRPGMTRMEQRRYNRWSRAVTELVPMLPGHYEVKTALGLGDGGAFEDWAFWQAGALSMCLELTSKKRFGQEGDLFLKYETFIFKSFVKALELDELQILVSSPTKETPENRGASKSH